MSATNATRPTVLLPGRESPLVLELQSRLEASDPPLLRTLLDSLSDAVIAIDAAGCVSYLNGAAEALTQLHVPATSAVLAALGWLEPSATPTFTQR